MRRRTAEGREFEFRQVRMYDLDNENRIVFVDMALQTALNSYLNDMILLESVFSNKTDHIYLPDKIILTPPIPELNVTFEPSTLV